MLKSICKVRAPLSDNEKELLGLVHGKKAPSKRRAYSDRTAWLMACSAELAYERFENKDQEMMNRSLSKRLEPFLNSKNKKKLKDLNQILIGLDPGKFDEVVSEFNEILPDADTIEKFNIDDTDTQAIIIPTKGFLILSFRGTEESYKDLKTDLDASTSECPSGGRTHSGFLTAYESIEAKIKECLEKEAFAKKPLYITGHSLGGALATISAKRLEHKGGIVACYAFGSPRVGDSNWTSTLKTPVYRVVNSVDPVPALPPGEGYLHCGDMRWLSDCPKGNYENVKLLFHVPFLWWLRAWVRAWFKGKTKFLPFLKGIVTEHKMSIYRRKLAIIALRRNKKYLSKNRS